MELYQIDESYGDLDEAAMSISDSSSGTALSGVYRTNWDSYGDDYCYQNLSTTWQELYDEMNLYCTAYMNTCVDAKVLSVNGRAVSGIGPIRYEGLTSEELSSLVYIFTYQNPQFYFIKNALYYNSKVVYLGVYDTFADGDTRSNASVQMFNRVDAWVQTIQKESTAYAKEKKAHDIICEYVEYEEGTYDQTAYSAVMQKKTVCAGYAKLYSMLTNAAGLETVSVTSATHGWNRTKLGNQWYNVDLTWDDGTPISYQFFNKSDATMEKYDGSSRESHTQNHYYDGVAPGCESDYGASVTVVDAEQIHADTATVVLDLVNNQSGQIRTSFVPANVTDKRLGYVSENTNIATVSASGLVTAVAPGKTSITIRKLTNNQKATCTIEVYGWQDEPETPTVAKYGSTWITLDTQSGCVFCGWNPLAVKSGFCESQTKYRIYLLCKTSNERILPGEQSSVCPCAYSDGRSTGGTCSDSAISDACADLWMAEAGDKWHDERYKWTGEAPGGNRDRCEWQPEAWNPIYDALSDLWMAALVVEWRDERNRGRGKTPGSN